LSGIWTKICGITASEDALAAAEFGADAVGLVLYGPSPRAVSPQSIGSIVAALPASMRKVALYVDPEEALVQESLQSGLINLLQFHGEETESFCSSFGVPYMKAIRVRSAEQALAQARAYPSAEMILLDRYQEDVPGGTGKTFDWGMAAEIVAGLKQPVILAGGLGCDNVLDAISRVKPFGVDVSSGVEAGHGIKDRIKMKQFIEGVKSV